MSFMLYEVWAVTDEGHEELIGTTASRQEANTMAEQALTDFVESWIMEENSAGDIRELSRLTLDENGTIIKL